MFNQNCGRFTDVEAEYTQKRRVPYVDNKRKRFTISSFHFLWRFRNFVLILILFMSTKIVPKRNVVVLSCQNGFFLDYSICSTVVLVFAKSALFDFGYSAFVEFVLLSVRLLLRHALINVMTDTYSVRSIFAYLEMSAKKTYFFIFVFALFILPCFTSATLHFALFSQFVFYADPSQ